MSGRPHYRALIFAAEFLEPPSSRDFSLAERRRFIRALLLWRRTSAIHRCASMRFKAILQGCGRRLLPTNYASSSSVSMAGDRCSWRAVAITSDN